MKTCADCKHSHGEGVVFRMCYAPQNMRIHAVSGEEEPRWRFCESHRDSGWVASRLWGMCGKDGRWFEPKEVA